MRVMQLHASRMRLFSESCYGDYATTLQVQMM
jgi:hypothetical protein